MTDYRKLLEALDILLHCNETHPSGKTKRERYYDYPVNPEEHKQHDTVKTGMYNVSFCNDCEEWFRRSDALYRKE